MKSTESKKSDSIPIRKYLAIYVVLFLAAILIMVSHYYETPITLADVQQAPPGVNTEKSEVGFKAPAFTARNLKGHRVQLADHRGKVVLLNLWATWCGPCRVEMPGMENLYRRYRAQGLEILAVSLDIDPSDKVQIFVDEYRLSFPVLLDSDGQVGSRYQNHTIPTTFVINKKGMIVAEVEGSKNWESEETFRAFELLLKETG